MIRATTPTHTFTFPDEVNYYALSGGTRSQNRNYTITAQIFGRILS